MRCAIVTSALLALALGAPTPSPANDGGHQRLLALLLPRIQEKLDGKIHIGRLSGDLGDALLLDDVEVLDREGQVAIRIAHLALRYELSGFLRGRVHLYDVLAQGVRIDARRLRDGRLNLATLMKPSTEQGKPLELALDHAHVEGALRMAEHDAQPPGAPWLVSDFTVEAHATAHAGTTEVVLDAMRLQVERPLEASAEGTATVTIAPAAPQVKALTLLVRTSGRGLEALMPSVKLRGTWAARLQAHGDLDRLELKVQALPPRGAIELDGVAALHGKHVDWQAHWRAVGVDPGAAVAGAPHGTVTVEASGRGRDAGGTIELAQLTARAGGAEAHASGRVGLGAPLTADVRATVDARDLSGLERVGGPTLRGALHAELHVAKDRAHTRLDAVVRAQKIAAPGAQLAALEARVHTIDLEGRALLHAREVTAGTLRLDELDLAASGDRKRLALQLEGRGPHGTLIALGAHGSSTAGSAAAVALSIDRLGLALSGQHFESTQPGELRIDRREVALALSVASVPVAGRPQQRLVARVRYGRESGALDGTFTLRRLDLEQLAPLARLRAELPSTDLDADVRLTGTRARPIVDVRLRGRSQALASRNLPALHAGAEAHLEDGRVRGELRLGSGPERLEARLDLPLDAAGAPLRLDVSAARLTLERWRGLLPHPLAGVKGRLDGSARLWGTRRRPQLEAQLELKRITWDTIAGAHATLALAYRGRALDLTVGAALGDRPDAATIDLKLAAPVELSGLTTSVERGRSTHWLERLQHEVPIDLKLAVRRFDVAKLPLARLGLSGPLRRGVLEADLTLHGTAHRPTIALRVDGRDLAVGRVAHIDAALEANYGSKRAQADAKLLLRGAPLLTARAEVGLDVQRLIDRDPRWRDAPLRVDATVPSYDLGRLSQLGGVVAGDIAVRGTLAAPTATARLAAERLRVGDMRFSRLAADGTLDGKHVLAHLNGDELSGGTLRASADVPRDPAGPLALAVDARAVRLAVTNLGPIRKLEGKLAAQLTLGGTRARPQLDGALRVSDGAVGVGNDPRLYQSIIIDLNVARGAVALNTVQVKVAEGKIAGSGTLLLDGLQPAKVDLAVDSDRFPFFGGNVGAWVDARLTLHGHRENGQLVGTLTVQKGTAHLPKIGGGKKLQSTGPLADVVFTDAAARRQRERRRRAAAGTDKPLVNVVAHVPGPFHVRSPEVSADFQGEVDLQLVDGVPKLFGAVEALSGHLELLGRRYEIERVRAGFDGAVEIDPAIDVRLTREISDTTIVIEVHGTAKKPELVVSSDPPIYDQSQIIGIIVSGDPGSQRISDRSTDQKVVGAISGLLVNKIKDQIAPGLPIDVIKVDTGAEGYTGLATTRLEVGKYITDSIYVSYVHQFGQPNTLHKINSNEANLEYRFKRHYEVATKFGDAGVGSVDLYWSYRF